MGIPPNGKKTGFTSATTQTLYLTACTLTVILQMKAPRLTLYLLSFISIVCTNFEKRENNQSSGGVKQSSRTTVADCQDYCQNEQTCVAFDWNRRTQECFAHLSQSNLDQQFPNNDVDLYIKACGNASSNLTK